MSSRRIVDLRKQDSPGRVRPAHRAPQREQKKLPLRARRRRVRLAIWFAGLLFVAGLMYGVHRASYLEQFTIDTVSIVGTEALPPHLVRTFVETELHNGSYHFFSRSNIFAYPREAIEQGLVAFFPRVKAASVSRPSLFSQTVIVTIEERQPFARWCTNLDLAESSACFEMDDSGFLFASLGATSTIARAFAQPYIFAGGLSAQESVEGGLVGQTFIPGRLADLLTVLTRLQQQADVSPLRVSVDNGQDFSVDFAEGFTLRASFENGIGTLARNLSLVLGSETLAGKTSQIEYVDLRFGSKVFYKFKEEQSD